jgi:hypothetical protein
LAFKQDEDFLRFLTMGARGSAAVARYLTDNAGHEMAELERYTMANKLWATKVKRLRLPDLMCLKCGVRVEAKAKSKLEIKVSDSSTGGREWDAGLRPSDFIAFVQCGWVDDQAIPSDTPSVFTADAMRRTMGESVLGPAKAASEGWERDRTWPAAVPGRNGIVLEVAPGYVLTKLDGGRRQAYRLARTPSYPYVRVGDRFQGGAQFLLGVVPPMASLTCPGGGWQPAGDLHADDPITRYAAVKALGLRRDRANLAALREIASNLDEDKRIALEAIASSARIDADPWVPRLVEVARGDSEAALAMEAVLILSEIHDSESAEGLFELASDHALSSELRSAAVWGLGVTGLQRADMVIRLLGDPDDLVALHALAGIGPVPQGLIPDLQALLRQDERRAATAAELLARQEEHGAAALVEAVRWPAPAKEWAIYGLGQMVEEVVRRSHRELPDSVTAGLVPMWLGKHHNWTRHGSNDEQLRFLERQTVRADPSAPR